MRVKSLLAFGVVLALAGGASSAVSANVKLTVTVAGKGTVTSAPKGIACPKACSKAFSKGKSVKLTPKAAAGWRFSRWTGACAKAKAVCTVKLTAAKKAGAVFTRVPPPPPPPPPPPTFTPQTLAGTWNGNWRNETFGSSGSASIIMTVTSPTTFTFTANLGGNVFGCPSPPPATGTVTQGTGPNTWNAQGFNVDITTDIGGKVALTYVFATSSMTGTGQSGCNPDVTWRMSSGTFTGNTFNGRIDIAFQGSPFATSVITLTRA